MFKMNDQFSFSNSHDCLVIGLFNKPSGFEGAMAEADQLFDGQLTELVKSGDISTKKKAISKIHTFSKIGAKKVYFVGLGHEKEYNFETLRDVFGRLFKTAKNEKWTEAAEIGRAHV